MKLPNTIAALFFSVHSLTFAQGLEPWITNIEEYIDQKVQHTSALLMTDSVGLMYECHQPTPTNQDTCRWLFVSIESVACIQSQRITAMISSGGPISSNQIECLNSVSQNTQYVANFWTFTDQDSVKVVMEKGNQRSMTLTLSGSGLQTQTVILNAPENDIVTNTLQMFTHGYDMTESPDFQERLRTQN